MAVSGSTESNVSIRTTSSEGSMLAMPLDSSYPAMPYLSSAVNYQSSPMPQTLPYEEFQYPQETRAPPSYDGQDFECSPTLLSASPPRSINSAYSKG